MNSEMRPDYALNFIRKNLESPILKQSQEALVWVQVILLILKAFNNLSKIRNNYTDHLVSHIILIL